MSSDDLNILFNDFRVFNVLGNEVNALAVPSEYGDMSILEINNKYYYYQGVEADISLVIFAWQYINNIVFTIDEMQDIILNNIIDNLVSESNASL